MKYKLIKILSVVLIFVFVLVGCGQQEQAPNTNEEPSGNAGEAKTDIVIATAVDFITMDPLDTNDTLSGGLQPAGDRHH